MAFKSKEKKLARVKNIKMNIEAMEKRIKETEKAIKETKNQLTKALCEEELEVLKLCLKQYKKDPDNTIFDDFAPLWERKSK
jgi:hypothetical protein